MSDERLAVLVSASALGFGVFATTAPRTLSRLLGVRDATNEFVYLLRFAGLESAALGVNLLTAPDARTRRRLLAVAAVVDGLDAVLTLNAGVSKRTAVSVGASTAVVALTAGLARSRTRRDARHAV
jgi:hypothetical protein